MCASLPLSLCLVLSSLSVHSITTTITTTTITTVCMDLILYDDHYIDRPFQLKCVQAPLFSSFCMSSFFIQTLSSFLLLQFPYPFPPLYVCIYVKPTFFPPPPCSPYLLYIYYQSHPSILHKTTPFTTRE